MIDSAEQTIAASPLLETKLYTPRWRPAFVSRPRLVRRLDQGTERKLTLVSAPAGFGKTTLLAEWIATFEVGERAAAWFSLDQRDNDPALFWAYFITALQKVLPDVGEVAISLLRSPQPVPIESVLTTLINEINAAAPGSSTIPGRGILLVLDDYHFIDAQPVHAGVRFLLDNLPPQMHMVITGRADPPLSLSRLRGRGELAELRPSDLRFTEAEAAAFLNDAMGLELTAADAAALETRTEGWIAGLQLAALSMQGRNDVQGFIKAFSGDDRYIVDYLVEEVLLRQSNLVRNFLLQTSILARLSGPLCDAVTDQEDGKEMLETLERGNLFVVPLDDKRRWYRYHHLFADVLHAHLMEEHPDLASTLHRRASEWYERNSSPADAIRHALAAKDFERAAGLIELIWPVIHRSFEDSTWLGWAKQLPDELVRARPVLSVGYAWTSLIAGDLESGESRLQDAERWLDAGVRSDLPSVKMVVADEAEFRTLPATIASARAFHALAVGDWPGTETFARRALELLPESNYFERAIPAGLLGLAYLGRGELETARRLVGEGMASLQKTGNILLAISGTPLMAEIRVTQGRLREAVSTYENALHLVAKHGERPPQGTAELYLGLTELCLEHGDPETAASHLLRSEKLNEQAPQDAYQYRWRVVKAQLKEAQGDLDGALDLLNDAERVYTPGVMPDIRPVAAMKARVWIIQNRLTEALDWVNKQNLSVDDDLSYLREFEHVTLARVLAGRYNSSRDDLDIHDAIELLERLLQAAEEGGRTGSVIEILVLQALAHAAQANTSRALLPLERALTLAEPEGYVRIFVGEGEPMRDLLRHAAAAGITGFYTQRLLSAFGEPDQSVASSRNAAAELADPLTAREIEVLRLIVAGLRNQEIADQLFISLSTVKRHIANGYGKMGVSHRTEAVARANELNLLS